MSSAPRNVWRLGILLGALLVTGMAAYVHFIFTGSYDLLVMFFRNAGAAFLISVTAAGAYFAYLARSQFDAIEPMRLAWTMVFLSACCQLAGLTCAQVLAMDIVWNPLILMGVFNAQRSHTLRDIGLVVGSPVALMFLAGGLNRVLILKRRLGAFGGLTFLERVFAAAVVIFAMVQVYEMGRMLSQKRDAVNAAQVLLWLTDPVLALLLIQAVSIRRFVLNLGDGLVARCWWMMAAGVAFTSAGDAFMWAETYSLMPLVLSPLGWFIWFFPVTAFACAPCYQLEAVRLAHKGSYSLRESPGE